MRGPLQIIAALGVITSQVIVACFPHAQSEQHDWCSNKNKTTSLDLIIGGCTAVIQSGRENKQNLAIAFYNRGMVYFRKGDDDRAAKDFVQAIRLDQKHAQQILTLALALSIKKDNDRTVRYSGVVIEADSRNANALHVRGTAYHDKGQFDLAIADLNQAIKLNPKVAAFYFVRSNCYFAKKEFDRAIRDYDEVAKMNPKNSLALFARGVAKRSKGDIDGADADIAAALSLDLKTTR